MRKHLLNGIHGMDAPGKAPKGQKKRTAAPSVHTKCAQGKPYAAYVNPVAVAAGEGILALLCFTCLLYHAFPGLSSPKP